MILATFIDANIPTYASGRPHPLREPCANILRLVVEHPTAFITSAEVLQELLHRQLALRTWNKGRLMFQDFVQIMAERIEPIYGSDVERAATLADSHPDLSARDLLHVAVMQRLGIRKIVSADGGFDQVPGIERLDPAKYGSWRRLVADEPNQ